MKIKLNKEDAKQAELIRLAGDRNKAVSAAAMEVLATLISPIIQTVIDKAALSDLFYTTLQYNQDENPSIPLDLYIDKKVDYINTWSMVIAGGLPTNEIQGLTEMKFKTYEIDSAVSMLKKFARVAGLEHVARALNRMAQEILVKQEVNRWTPALAALAAANTNNLAHVITATTTGIIQLDDFNKLLVRGRLINAAFDGGTPVAGGARGVTDLFLSATDLADIRAFAYNPMNTRTVDGAAGTPAGSSTAMPLPDGVREEIYRSAGTPEIFGIGLHEVLELETTAPYSLIFDNFYAGTFTAGTHTLAFGVDMTREGCLAPVEVDDFGSKATVFADDQFVARTEKIGWYAKASQGAVIVDDRQLVGLII
jgi:hypothetical protein